MTTNPITPLTPTEIATQEQTAAAEGPVKRDLVAFDQFVNVLADGDPDETISARMARWATEDAGLKRDVGSAVSAALNLAEPDHGAKAEAGDLERAQKVAAVEQQAEGA